MSFKETEVGKIPLDWDVAKLGDVADVLSGFAFKSKDFIDNGVPVIKIKNIVPPYVTKDDAVYVSQELYESSEKYQLNYNDILISMTGSNYNQLSSAVGKVGRVRLKDEPMLLNQRVGKIITNEKKCDKEFLYYNISTMETRYRLALSAGGSANQANVSPKQIKSLIIPYPPLDEQKVIAHILSTIDEKIEVNNQINKTLENMAQAIFKQWFVDFEFPNEDGEPYKSSGGEMIESELGMIPKGWEVRRIGDECFCSLGGTPSRQKSDYWNGDIPWVNSGEVNNFRIYKPSEYITKLGLEKSATKLLKKKTTVLAITGATLGQVSLLEIDTCTNQSVVGISENDKISHVYIYPYVKSVIKKIIGNQTGGAQQHINKGNVEDTKLLIPNKKVLNAYTKLVRPQYDLISSICFENELLTRLRDSLIPKLMSGEIRVPLDEDGDVS